MTIVKFDDLCLALESSNDLDNSAFIKKGSGEIYFLDDEIMSYAEKDSEDEYPDWMEDGVQKAREYNNNPDAFFEVPMQSEVDEYSMMEDFAISLNDDIQTEKLLIAIRGKGAFRRFKDLVMELNIQDAWYDYRKRGYVEFAKEWAEENNIKLVLE